MFGLLVQFSKDRNLLAFLFSYMAFCLSTRQFGLGPYKIIFYLKYAINKEVLEKKLNIALVLSNLKLTHSYKPYVSNSGLNTKEDTI